MDIMTNEKSKLKRGITIIQASQADVVCYRSGGFQVQIFGFLQHKSTALDSKPIPCNPDLPLDRDEGLLIKLIRMMITVDDFDHTVD